MFLIRKVYRFAILFLRGEIFLLLLCFHTGTSCPSQCHCSDNTGVMVVHCSSRNLEGIPNDIPMETVLLKLDGNKISQIPNNVFRHLDYLQELDLSKNAIEKIEIASFTGITEGLRLLDLSNNHINNIPEGALAKLRAKIRIANNPWNCDCAFQDVLQELKLDPETVNEIICQTSEQKEYAGKPLIQLLDAGVNFCRILHNTPDVAMFITMFGWFTLVITYVVYYIRHNQEDARRHSEYLKSLPSAQIAKDFDTVNTML
ncbi:leucine-rich repeat-containing protein 3-like [Rhinatrema bivittatum]|uniref:leucine-rich repeat-containing protein 3-like n=1 Tax=Rhinatrema bivittatum TaxID=194408 RepID=UPI00112AD5FF|nr:leucine-rich repeat-containing protein 3-like [Rhinatrema bivittatum]XP_029460777.1 leucine-rich repeat-containing protein 3-like [Rhinatrema bivittatum]